MQKEVKNDFKVITCIVPAVRNSDVNGTGVDTAQYNSLTFLAVVGDSADTLSGTNKIEIETEESDDNSSYTDVANADLEGYVAATNTGTFALIDAPTEDQTTFVAGYKGGKRYARPVLNFSGTHSTGTPIGVIGVLSNAKYPPAA